MRIGTFASGKERRSTARRPWNATLTRRLTNLLIPVSVLLVCLTVLGVIYRRPIAVTYDIGGPGPSLDGLYAPEQNDRFTYAFMGDSASLSLPNVGQGAFVAQIRMGGPNADQPVQVALGSTANLVNLGAVQAIRTYSILLPDSTSATEHLSLTSTTVRENGAGRALGALLDTISLASLTTLAPPASVLWAVPVLFLVAWLIITQLTSRQPVRFALLAALAVAICVVYGLNRGVQNVELNWFGNPLLYGGVALIAARTLLVPERRAWLRSARWVTVPLTLFIATRIGIALVAYLADPLISDGMDHGDAKDNIVLEVFTQRWDSAFYLEIANNGYYYSREVISAAPFFPLLPLAIRALTPLVGSANVAGLIVTNTALLGATMVFYRLVDHEWGAVIAERAVWYLLIFPFSFFGSFVYSESLLLLASVGALYAARHKSWWLAALCGACASLSRPVGVILAPMLLVEWWTQYRSRPPAERPPLAALLTPAAVPLGLGLFMLYLQYKFGDPLAFIHAQEAWGRMGQTPLVMLQDLASRTFWGGSTAFLSAQIPLDNLIDLFCAVTFCIIGVILLFQRRWSESVFVLCGTLMPVSTGVLTSERRFVWILFPAFILFARWGEHQWFDRLITTFFLLGLAFFTAMIANHYWVA